MDTRVSMIFRLQRLHTYAHKCRCRWRMKECMMESDARKGNTPQGHGPNELIVTNDR